MRSDVLFGIAVMLGVGYLVFRESGGGSMSAPSVPSSATPVTRGAPSVPSRGVPARHPFTLAPSSGVSAGNAFESTSLPAWFIKSVETPLPKRFVGKIYERNIAAIKGLSLIHI